MFTVSFVCNDLLTVQLHALTLGDNDIFEQKRVS